MTTPTGYLAFLDAETTGLDERKCHLLEVACVVTTRDLVEVGSYEALVKPPPYPHWEPKARTMHETPGPDGKCLEELARTSGRPPHVVAEKLEAFLRPFAGELYLAGNTCHFDRRWLAQCMPQVEGMFRHRHYDVSGLFLWAEQLGLERRPNAAHRAMVDVRHCLVELRRLNAFFGVGDARIRVVAAALEVFPPDGLVLHYDKMHDLRKAVHALREETEQ